MQPTLTLRLPVTDLDQTVHFYCECLHTFTVDVFADMGGAHPRLILSAVAAPGISLEPRLVDHVPPCTDPNDSLLVLSVRDLEKCIAVMRSERTVFLSEPIETPFDQQVVVRDPSGHGVCLSQPHGLD